MRDKGREGEYTMQYHSENSKVKKEKSRESQEDQTINEITPQKTTDKRITDKLTRTTKNQKYEQQHTS